MKSAQLQPIIEKIATDHGLNRSEVAAKANVGRSYLSNLLSKHPEKEVGNVVLRKFKNAFPAYFPEKNKKEQKAEGSGYSNLSEQALLNLTESNKTLAESNVILARSHEELIKMAKSGLTGGEEKQTLLASVSMLQALQEYTVSLVSEVKKITPQEAAAQLGIIANRIHGRRKKSSVAGGDK